MSQKPNMIYIVADQWRGDCLGLYRNHHPVMTPHLNQLACEGINYTHGYADCPLCMPQRATMLTGRTGSQNRCIKNFTTENAPHIDPQQTLPGRLTREAGYQTKAIGKMHFAPHRARHGFEHVSLHPDDYLWWLEEQGQGGSFRAHGLGGNEVYPTESTCDQRYYHTTWIVDQAIRFLEQRDPTTPFFLYIIFEAPHSPFDPPPPYDRMYDNFTIPAPIEGDWRESDYPATFQEKRILSKYDFMQPEAIAEARRRYYGQMTHIDYQLGRLFGALQTQHIYQETAIAFTADHGESLGDHGVFAKHSFLESAARVPYILRLPSSMQAQYSQLNSEQAVLTADFCPTMLEMAGLAPDHTAEGQSLLQPNGREYIFGETPESAMVLGEGYKYIYYLTGGTEQLFHVEQDRDDRHNLAGQATQSARQSQLKNQLIAYLSKNNSPMVSDGAFIQRTAQNNAAALRRRNPLACRGPMHGGDGY
ncbi:sulfatase-like hydrolase/transferase [Coraliomargarita sp. SDUM461003]|uniref:Sulfatase-like hydrolase/transferase n=1 Tax=Thalassobacterium maritimum TaxID=3041265 RepID=A0ABU1ASY9_9BACT|nr:sulfatase-like hydrolase/transferase [Coraliomargarita sp. SDUM461003]MDQ8207281.1 sulfatase-like hydrolase/transferase [Coraliomargarita sp. SDUM461003]